jgi:hypothetical protein
VVAKLFLVACILAFAAHVRADNCSDMADMATDVARLRDAGVHLSSVEARLRRDVSVQEELGMALIVTRLVYRTKGTAQELRRAVLAKCK